MNIKASVVILNWNGKSLMEELLESVVRFSTCFDDFKTEVVVADNGSTDGSVEFLKNKFFGSVKIIDLQYNHGFAEGYNIAISQLDSEYLVLLNSDVEVTPDWLKILIDYLDSNKDVVACQPKIRSLREKDKFEHAGASGGFIDILGYPFCRGRVLSSLEIDRGQYDEPKDVFWATGACLCIRTQEFRKAGGFDARFFAHMEEIDLCWRLRSRGKRITCVSESIVYHLGGATLNKENPKKTFLNYRNNLLMLYKNCESKILLRVFLARFFMDYLSALLFLLSGKFRDASAVFRARRSFWKMLPDFKAQRIENLTLTTNKLIPEIYKGSILFEYYLLGKRTFAEIFK